MKNTIKYDTPYLRDVDIARLLKDADKAFDNEQMLDLSEDELYNIMAKRPRVKGSKVMDVLIKWAKKRFALEAPKAEKRKKLLRKKRKKWKKSRILKWPKKRTTMRKRRKKRKKILKRKKRKQKRLKGRCKERGGEDGCRC